MKKLLDCCKKNYKKNGLCFIYKKKKLTHSFDPNTNNWIIISPIQEINDVKRGIVFVVIFNNITCGMHMKG